MIGKTISHYKILEKLGEGGMGEVYLAEDSKLDRKVALKFLPKEYTKDREAGERFEREAKAAAALNHPNIVTIHEINEHEDQTYIAMEYVEGSTIKDKIASGSFPMADTLKITTLICEGLQKAHEAGIVAVIQPGGSMRDEEVIAAANEHGMAMIFTGMRHFRH